MPPNPRTTCTAYPRWRAVTRKPKRSRGSGIQHNHRNRALDVALDVAYHVRVNDQPRSRWDIEADLTPIGRMIGHLCERVSRSGETAEQLAGVPQRLISLATQLQPLAEELDASLNKPSS